MRHAAWAVVGASVALTVTACSSSGASSTPRESPVTHASVAGSGMSGAAAAGSTGSTAASGATGAVGSVASSSGVAAGPADIGRFCALITRNNTVFRDLTAGDTRSGGVDRSRLEHDLEASVPLAPAEIKSDLQAIVAFDEKRLSDPRNTQLTPQLEAATQRYAIWVGRHCRAGG